MGLKAAILVLAMASPATATDLSAPYAPDDAQLAVIRDGLSARMLDPTSTIVSQVLARDQVDGKAKVTWACGKVRGKNTFGGYAPDTWFFGTTMYRPDGSAFFLPMIIAKDAAQSEGAVRMCLEKMQ